jgi:putative flippase GtrA
MRLAQLLPQRLQTLAPEAVKFAVIGGLNVVVNAVVFNLLLALSLFENGQLKAKVVATCVAIVSSYFMNRHWTYKDRDKSAAHREFVLFVVFNMAGMAIELAVMGITKYWFGLTSLLALNVALVVGLALGTVFRFFTYRTYVFTHAADAPVPVVAAEFEELTAPLEAEFARKQRRTAKVKRRSPAPARTR